MAIPAKIIVCEQTGRWATALRRELSAKPGFSARRRLAETRSLAECRESLQKSPAAFVVVELTLSNARRLLRLMEDLEWKFPLARLAVVIYAAEMGTEPPGRLEALLRQSGAVFFADSLRGEGPRGVRALASVARRHLRHAPQPQQSLRAEIWSRLPWHRPHENP